jgi:hypothetical protein
MPTHTYTCRTRERDKSASTQPRRVEPASEPVFQHRSANTTIQRAALAPGSLRPAEIERMQRTLGNRAVGALLTQRPVIEPKLMINAAGDQYEQEADRMADEVMRAPVAEREEMDDDEQPGIMAKREPTHAAGGAFEASEEFEERLRATRGQGRPLPPALQEDFEAKFGADFSGVRIHSDVQSTWMNQEIQARAFTHEQDIYLGANQPSPETAQAKPLLAHELTHVLQQTGKHQRPIRNPLPAPGPNVSTGSIQRLPMSADIEQEVGVHHSGAFESTKYKPVLKALDEFHEYTKGTPASNHTLDNLMGRYAKVRSAALNYLEKKGTRRSRDDIEQLGNERDKYRKLKRLLALADEVAVERVQAVLLAGSMEADGKTTWATVLEDRSRGRSTRGLKKLHIYGDVFGQSDIRDKQKGGTNEVAKVKAGQKQKGFWKADKSDLPLTPLIKAFQDVEGREGEKMGAFLPGTRFETMGFQAIENEYNVPMLAGIIPAYDLPELDIMTNMPKRPKTVAKGDVEAEKEMAAWRSEKQKRQTIYNQEIRDRAQQTNLVQEYDLHLAKRDVAMYRLDQLLNVGIIAPTKLALMKSKEEYKLGSLMKAAEGTQAGEVAWDTVNQQGGELQRLLSRLQLLDILAHQVDRNPGNFFLQFQGGEVTHITGIDNDMAFGKLAQDISRGFQEYPGVSKYVDKDLAQAILKLAPKDLGDAMRGLLSDDEIDALIGRLKQLQIHLKKLSDQDRLLSPDQWSKATAQGLIDEGASYYAILANRGLIKKQQ